MLPIFAAPVFGVGAVDVLSLLVKVEYHSKPVPDVTDKAEGLSPTQYLTGELTPGAAGIGFTVTLTLSAVPSQKFAPLAMRGVNT